MKGWGWRVSSEENDKNWEKQHFLFLSLPFVLNHLPICVRWQPFWPCLHGRKWFTAVSSLRERETLWETAHFGNCSNAVKTIRWLFSQFHSCVLPFGCSALRGNVLFLTPRFPELLEFFTILTDAGEKGSNPHNTKWILCPQTKKGLKKTKHLWLHRCAGIQKDTDSIRWCHLCAYFWIYSINDQRIHEIMSSWLGFSLNVFWIQSDAYCLRWLEEIKQNSW